MDLRCTLWGFERNGGIKLGFKINSCVKILSKQLLQQKKFLPIILQRSLALAGYDFLSGSSSAVHCGEACLASYAKESIACLQFICKRPVASAGAASRVA